MSVSNAYHLCCVWYALASHLFHTPAYRPDMLHTYILHKVLHMVPLCGLVYIRGRSRTLLCRKEKLNIFSISVFISIFQLEFFCRILGVCLTFACTVVFLPCTLGTAKDMRCAVVEMSGKIEKRRCVNVSPLCEATLMPEGWDIRPVTTAEPAMDI